MKTLVYIGNILSKSLRNHFHLFDFIFASKQNVIIFGYRYTVGDFCMMKGGGDLTIWIKNNSSWMFTSWCLCCLLKPSKLACLIYENVEQRSYRNLMILIFLPDVSGKTSSVMHIEPLRENTLNNWGLLQWYEKWKMNLYLNSLLNLL